MQPVNETQQQRRPKRRGNLPSLFFFGLAIVLLVVAAFVYHRDQVNAPTPPPAPTALPGKNQLTDVLNALDGVGIKLTGADIQHTTVSSSVLTPPGQPLDVDGGVLYVFIYTSGPSAAKQEAAQANPTNVLPPDAGTAPATTAKPRIYVHSNVVAVLVGGSDK